MASSHSKVRQVHHHRKHIRLGSELQHQLVKTDVMSSPSQTDWKWCKMAMRWKHAKIILCSLDRRALDEEAALRKASLFGDSVLASLVSSGQLLGDEIHMPPELMPGPVDMVIPEGGMTPEEGAFPPENMMNDEAKKRLEDALLRRCGRNDKCQDTSDLWFDPFDTRLRYTKKASDLRPAYIPHKVRLSIEEGRISPESWTRTGGLFIDLDDQ